MALRFCGGAGGGCPERRRGQRSAAACRRGGPCRRTHGCARGLLAGRARGVVPRGGVSSPGKVERARLCSVLNRRAAASFRNIGDKEGSTPDCPTILFAGKDG